MKDAYRYEEATADLIQDDHPGVWVIASVRNRRNNGEGHASAVLKKVCEDADREGITLILQVAPDDDCRMTEYQLADWYGRNGFQFVAPETPPFMEWMVRPPELAAKKIDPDV